MANGLTDNLAARIDTTPQLAMAASVSAPPHPDLPEAATTPGQKRKRASESASPDSRRSKRGAPAAAMAVPETDTETFLENTVSIAQAAHDHVNVDDFSALAQATAADHGDAADATNASNTAAAALNMYPSLHVPQSTEEAFANQATPETHHHETHHHETHHEENGFNNHPAANQPDGLPMVSPPPLQQQQPPPPPPPNGLPQVQEPRYSAPNPKPAVGSEEWHKMRKDNHKEGKPHSRHPHPRHSF